MNSKLAPIVLFVYNRLRHTKRTIEMLKENKLASESHLYIYSDAPREKNEIFKIKEVRDFIKTVNGFKSVTIIERKINLGLADSIIDGVTKIVNEHGKVIVLEDDLLTGHYFLEFMNDALELYKNNQKVAHINGYNFDIKNEPSKYFFTKMAFSWGWATWAESWKLFNNDVDAIINEVEKNKLIDKINYHNSYNLYKQLEDNKNKKIYTWAIKWHALLVLHDKYSLTPEKTLVLNIGNDGSGTNSSSSAFFIQNLNNDQVLFIEEELVIEKEDKEIQISKKFKDMSFNYKRNRIKNFFLKISKIFKYIIRPIYIKLKTYTFKFKNLQAYISSNVSINIKKLSNIKLGCNVHISDFTTIHVVGNTSANSDSKLIIGDNTYIGEFNNIRAGGGDIYIGSHCLISQHITLVAANHSISKNDLISIQEWGENKHSIFIGDDVWIGSHSVILPGVTIGTGAVVGAGSIVTKDIQPYSIVAGNPARKIKERI